MLFAGAINLLARVKGLLNWISVSWVTLVNKVFALANNGYARTNTLFMFASTLLARVSGTLAEGRAAG